MDYKSGKIYCIRNDINDEIYVGSTTQSLSQRMAKHRSDKKKRIVTVSYTKLWTPSELNTFTLN